MDLCLNDAASAQVSVTMRQQLSLNPIPFFCMCLFQIMFQWELSLVARWAPPFCCLFFYWRSPSSCTANAKAVSAHSRSLMCLCRGMHTLILCVCVSISLSFIHSLQLSFCFSWKKGTLASHIASDINEYSYNMANCLKTPTVHFPFNSFDLYL